MKLRWSASVSVVLLFTSGLLELHAAEKADKKKQPLGIFEQATDVGEDLLRGSSSYDPVKKQYTIKGGGADIYGGEDDFHFLWRRVSGNWISFTCTLELPPEGNDPYPKAGLMFRESLESDASYVDVLLHANGTIALQWRRAAGEQTGQLVPSTKGNRLMLERKNDWLVIWVGTPDGGFVECGSIAFDLPRTFYAGLAVCAHNADQLLTVQFSDVTLDDDTGQRGP